MGAFYKSWLPDTAPVWYLNMWKSADGDILAVMNQMLATLGIKLKSPIAYQDKIFNHHGAQSTIPEAG